MEQGGTFRIQTEAAEALATWKAVFAENVTARAKELARDDNSAGLVTVDHYRQAAKTALQALATLFQDTTSNDGHREAA